MWNFYEWSEGSDRDWEITRKPDDPYVKDYDLTLNAMFVCVIEKYDAVCGTKHDTGAIKEGIRRHLFDSESGVYKLSKNDNRKTQLGNVYAILAGLGNEEIAKVMKKTKKQQ